MGMYDKCSRCGLSNIWGDHDHIEDCFKAVTELLLEIDSNVRKLLQKDEEPISR